MLSRERDKSAERDGMLFVHSSSNTKNYLKEENQWALLNACASYTSPKSIYTIILGKWQHFKPTNGLHEIKQFVLYWIFLEKLHNKH